MKLVIAGCGNVGYYLAKTLAGHKYNVSVIEKRMDRCEWIEKSSLGRKIILVHGDATNEQILGDAGVNECDTFIAVTGQDQNNLTSCMLAKQLLKAKRTITRVNNPKNIRVFQRLGVDGVVSSADRISNMIEQELELVDIDSILSEKTENTRISQCIVGTKSEAAGKKVSSLRLPPETIIIVVVRGNRAYIPNGAFCLEGGDEAVIMGSENNIRIAQNMLYDNEG